MRQKFAIIFACYRAIKRLTTTQGYRKTWIEAYIYQAKYYSTQTWVYIYAYLTFDQSMGRLTKNAVELGTFDHV